MDLCEPEWSQSVGGLGLYLLVTLLRQASPKRGRMIHVLVPQHVLTLIPLDSAAEGRESARRGNLDLPCYANPEVLSLEIIEKD